MSVLASLARALAAAAAACPICYGANDYGGLKDGLTWGLIILLTSTFAIVLTLVYAVLRLERRKTLADAALRGRA